MKFVLVSTLCHLLAVQGFLPSSKLVPKIDAVSPTALFTEGKQQEKELLQKKEIQVQQIVSTPSF